MFYYSGAPDHVGELREGEVVAHLLHNLPHLLLNPRHLSHPLLVDLLNKITPEISQGTVRYSR